MLDFDNTKSRYRCAGIRGAIIFQLFSSPRFFTGLQIAIAKSRSGGYAIRFRRELIDPQLITFLIEITASGGIFVIYSTVSGETRNRGERLFEVTTNRDTLRWPEITNSTVYAEVAPRKTGTVPVAWVKTMFHRNSCSGTLYFQLAT